MSTKQSLTVTCYSLHALPSTSHLKQEQYLPLYREKTQILLAHPFIFHLLILKYMYTISTSARSSNFLPTWSLPQCIGFYLRSPCRYPIDEIPPFCPSEVAFQHKSFQKHALKLIFQCFVHCYLNCLLFCIMSKYWLFLNIYMFL